MRYLIIFFALIFFTSCDKEEENPCTDIQACTEVFVTITVEITDRDGNPVVLDNYYTFIDQRNRFDYTDASYNLEDGKYLVATDSEMSQLNFAGINVVFIGELGGINVVEQPLVLGKDCCHIKLLKGETNIQIEL
jgi:hypothetical protein